MKKKAKGKIVMVGAGFVGSTIAYTAVVSGIASEIVFVDVNRDKAEGEAMDMSHGLAYVKQVDIRAGEYSDCKDADIVVITAGINRKPGQSRLDLAKINVKIVQDVIVNVTKYTSDAIILVVSNPVDILTYFAQKISGLPRYQVIGTGTTLDTARFKYLIGKNCEVNVRNVHAYIIGEHGDSEVPLWSTANIAGKPLEEFWADSGKDGAVEKSKLIEDVRDAGAEIIKKKGATYYGIGLTTTNILSAMLGNENSVLTVSSVLDGEYGIKDVALSLPSVVNVKGIDRIFNINISEDEQLMLNESATKLKETIRQVENELK
ncbi:L-lactate dehydrogenase [Tepidanaerobacter syntrophicus]|uniref:L-lactate dehydrogenase n=1 Tax=Tepidanaerobacter syntrophicus TaxID=224999 RepID=A0A0U9HFR5_9FIRM|nr:L-lactate dehydrogenase [Tepidanaerobacter syntrophicus]GAQ25682.1 L-lactate dehydrogenase [Tepidanaerobacter syntrophicus]